MAWGLDPREREPYPLFVLVWLSDYCRFALVVLVLLIFILIFLVFIIVIIGISRWDRDDECVGDVAGIRGA
jgi:hypothetical protein